MGKQARGRARARNGTERHAWMPARTKREQDINRHLPREWLDEAEPPDPLAYSCRAPALILHNEDWPRSATGHGELDDLLSALWRN